MKHFTLICIAIFLTVFLFTENTIAQNKQEVTELTIVINGFKMPKGKVDIKLYGSKSDYESGTVYKKLSKELTSQKIQFIFSNLPYGEYAISWHHDSNNNGKFDTNIIGIPTESYGFSNNAKGSFGPATYADVCFKLDSLKVLAHLKVNR